VCVCVYKFFFVYTVDAAALICAHYVAILDHYRQHRIILVIRVDQLLHSQGLCPAVYNHIRGQLNPEFRNYLQMCGIVNMKLSYNSVV
jgi:hypothetical protein